MTSLSRLNKFIKTIFFLTDIILIPSLSVAAVDIWEKKNDNTNEKQQVGIEEKVIIERINIVGNSVTNDSVIRSALIVDEGDHSVHFLLINQSIKLKILKSQAEEFLLYWQERK